jgi:tetratricopeptide (TPR) repeat protein
LAYWEKAVEDYTTALGLGKKATGFDEPYVLNSRGNAFASLGKWSEALQDYELSVKVGSA